MSYFQKIEDKEKWQELLSKALFKTFFHTLEWEEFLEKELGWLRFDRYLYKDELLLSLAKYKVLGKEKLISHPFCEYGGPLPLVEKIDGEKFKQDLFLEFESPLEINLHPWMLNYLKDFKLEKAESWRSTYWIKDFSKLRKEKLLASFRYDVRHSIKRAQKQGFSFEECQSDTNLKEFYSLYVKIIKRHKNIPLPYSFFEFFWKFSKIFFLKSNKKIITGSIFLFYRPFIHYFITASDDNFRKLGINHLLLWRVIEKYAGKHYDFLDLGATKEGSKLEIFKRGWRGKKIPIYELSGQLSKSRLRDSGLRNVLGLLPLFLTEKISPCLLKYKL